MHKPVEGTFFNPKLLLTNQPSLINNSTHQMNKACKPITQYLYLYAPKTNTIKRRTTLETAY